MSAGAAPELYKERHSDDYDQIEGASYPALANSLTTFVRRVTQNIASVIRPGVRSIQQPGEHVRDRVVVIPSQIDAEQAVIQFLVDTDTNRMLFGENASDPQGFTGLLVTMPSHEAERLLRLIEANPDLTEDFIGLVAPGMTALFDEETGRATRRGIVRRPPKGVVLMPMERGTRFCHDIQRYPGGPGRETRRRLAIEAIVGSSQFFDYRRDYRVSYWPGKQYPPRKRPRI
jgi:hypothetical protein